MSTVSETTAPAGSQNVATNIRVYNTLTRTKQPLATIVPGKVGIYLCGPTVYDKAHIGHMVGPVIFDTIKRYLTYSGYEVTLVVNITDVDDKLINKAAERGISMRQVAEENTADYLANLAGLGVDQIDHMPKATETMDEIIALTGSLIDKRFAYDADGDVFFDVAKDPEYGKLTNRSVDEVEGDGGGAAAKKRSPADFALWKSAKPDEPSWDSPWGKGRPGWHIECSAMSRKLLGETFDIHGGGLDLIFPHHENEIAQSECCHGKPMANVWMHNGLLRRAAAGKIGGRGERDGDDDGEKMSRSKGAGGLADQIAHFGGELIRFFLLRTHYRSTVLFGEEALQETAASLDTFYRFFKRYERITGESFYDIKPPASRFDPETEVAGVYILSRVREHRDEFRELMDDDFNTGAAIAELFELVRVLNRFVETESLEDAVSTKVEQSEELAAHLRTATRTLRELTTTLGLFLAPLEQHSGAGVAIVDDMLGLIVELRAAARKNKDFATADKIRDSLTDKGITLEDRTETEWTIEHQSGAGDKLVDELLGLIVELRAAARKNKDFATADKIRDSLKAMGITMEDRADETE